MYCDHFRDNDYEDKYFGWFSNRLPYYPDTLNIKTYAIPKSTASLKADQFLPTLGIASNFTYWCEFFGELFAGIRCV